MINRDVAEKLLVEAANIYIRKHFLMFFRDPDRDPNHLRNGFKELEKAMQMARAVIGLDE